MHVQAGSHASKLDVLETRILSCKPNIYDYLWIRAHLVIDALWSPAGKGLTSCLSFVMSNCEVATFPLVSWVRCGAWLYRFLIFALCLTFPSITGTATTSRSSNCFMGEVCTALCEIHWWLKIGMSRHLWWTFLNPLLQRLFSDHYIIFFF